MNYMAESMRGSRLGSTSYESDSAEFAPRQLTTFVCPEGHQFTMPFFIEADEIPDTWECECGELALRLGARQPEAKPVKIAKTHYDMLMERRTKKDLENLLKERMELLRKPQKAS
jgi:hypothetical protein